MKCEHCDKPAVVHEVVIHHGEKKEVHLCEQHAEEAGMSVTTSEPIDQLLTKFITSSQSKASSSDSAGKASLKKRGCSSCGMSFADFRKTGTLGCSQCYVTYGEQLGPLIQRAHAGATHHVGKAPQRAGGSINMQMLRHRLVRELDEAVAAEQYERAAKLRDRLEDMQSEAGSESSQPGRDPATRTRGTETHGHEGAIE